MDTGYFRWDYVSFWFDCAPDLFHTHLAYLDGLMNEVPPSHNWKQQMKVHAHGPGQGDSRRYSITIFGAAATVVSRLPVFWHKFIRRLDIKCWPPELDEAAVVEMRDVLLNSKTGYNVTGHNGKPRQKTDKRDAGGNSLSIGSHKSDLRISVYQRSREHACLEFQVSGDMLKRVFANQLRLGGSTQRPAGFWTGVKSELQELGNARFNRCLVNAGVVRWRPTTQAEREAAALDEVDRRRSQEAEQAQLDIDAAWSDEAGTPPIE